jgi:hypothetical protein
LNQPSFKVKGQFFVNMSSDLVHMFWFTEF